MVKVFFKMSLIIIFANISLSLYGQNKTEEEFVKGLNYFYGKNGVCQDYNQAYKSFLYSAKLDMPEAQFLVSFCYLNGLGIVKNDTEAFNWILKASKQGFPDALYWIGKYYIFGWGCPVDEKKGIENLLQAADKGVAEAQDMLGGCYMEAIGVERDERKGFKWKLKAAEKGLAIAQNSVGWYYATGQGTEMDYKKALEWYEKSAAQDEAWAFNNMAYLYFRGHGVDKDINKALNLVDKAIELDSEELSFYDSKGEFYSAIGDNEKAMEMWYKMLDINSEQIDETTIFANYLKNLGIDIKKEKENNVWIIEPQFDEVRSFSESYAAVRNDDKWGFIDYDGKIFLSIKFDSVADFHNGYSAVTFGGVKGLVDKRGVFLWQKDNPSRYQSLLEKNKQKGKKEELILLKRFDSLNEKWGYKKPTLIGYINTNLSLWSTYLSSNLSPLEDYKSFLKRNIERDINSWQQKGEFEPTVKWEERVNETTRKQKIEELTLKYKNEYEIKSVIYQKRYAELAEEYKREYAKYRDEYYTLIIQSKDVEFRLANFELMAYDADNQSFMIKSDKQGDILMSVPLEEAPLFKQNWNTIKQTITPTFVPSGDDVVLTSVTVTNGNKKYVYDSHTQAKYAVTDINYNFDPVEISIPEVADVNYTFDPVEVIQSTVVQTSPTVKGLEANNTTIERKSIDATKQSDVDINIPQNTIQKNSNTFVVIIANEDYQRVSDVQYANNDGKLFAEYCQKTLGLPQNHVMVYNDATLGNMLGAVSRIKEIGEAYNGKVNVVLYYAGHGIPDETSKDAYLLPVDGDGSSVRTCYKQSELYSELASIKAESIVVFMDACFSGSLRGDGMLASARGVAIKAKKSNPVGNMVVFSAAQGDETAYPYKEQRHGMFTYYLLKKLQETKGEATLGEISDYVTSEVRRQSIVINGKMQTPTLTSSSAVGDAWRNWKLK